MMQILTKPIKYKKGSNAQNQFYQKYKKKVYKKEFTC